LENRSATKTGEKENEQIEKKMHKTLVQENIRDRQAEADRKTGKRERLHTHTPTENSSLVLAMAEKTRVKNKGTPVSISLI
jgi:hypothetical protein